MPTLPVRLIRLFPKLREVSVPPEASKAQAMAEPEPQVVVPISVDVKLRVPPDMDSPVPVMSVRESVPKIKVVAAKVLAVAVPRAEILGEPLPVISPAKVKAATLEGSKVPDIV